MKNNRSNIVRYCIIAFYAISFIIVCIMSVNTMMEGYRLFIINYGQYAGYIGAIAGGYMPIYVFGLLNKEIFVPVFDAIIDKILEKNDEERKAIE